MPRRSCHARLSGPSNPCDATPLLPFQTRDHPNLPYPHLPNQSAPVHATPYQPIRCNPRHPTHAIPLHALCQSAPFATNLAAPGRSCDAVPNPTESSPSMTATPIRSFTYLARQSTPNLPCQSAACFRSVRRHRWKSMKSRNASSARAPVSPAKIPNDIVLRNPTFGVGHCIAQHDVGKVGRLDYIVDQPITAVLVPVDRQ